MFFLDGSGGIVLAGLYLPFESLLSLWQMQNLCKWKGSDAIVWYPSNEIQ